MWHISCQVYHWREPAWGGSVHIAWHTPCQAPTTLPKGVVDITTPTSRCCTYLTFIPLSIQQWLDTFFLLSFRKKYDSKSHVLRSDFIESEGETRLPVTVIILLARKNAATTGKGGVCHTFLLVQCSRLVVSKTWHHHRQPIGPKRRHGAAGVPTRRALTDAPERNPTSNYCPTITLPIDDL